MEVFLGANTRLWIPNQPNTGMIQRTPNLPNLGKNRSETTGMIQRMIDEIALGGCNTSKHMVMLGFWLQPFVCTHHHFSPVLTLKHYLGCCHLTSSSFLAISKNGKCFKFTFGGLYFQLNKKKLVVSGYFHNMFLEQNQATRCCPLSFRFFARSWWVEFLFWKRNRTWDYVTLEKYYVYIYTQLLKSFIARNTWKI